MGNLFVKEYNIITNTPPPVAARLLGTTWEEGFNGWLRSKQGKITDYNQGRYGVSLGKTYFFIDISIGQDSATQITTSVIRTTAKQNVLLGFIPAGPLLIESNQIQSDWLEKKFIRLLSTKGYTHSLQKRDKELNA